MNSYKSSAELKALAKERLFGKYGAAVGAAVIWALASLLTMLLPNLIIPSVSVGGAVINYLISFILRLFLGIFESGLAFLYLKITCGQPVSTGDIFYGFKANPDKALFIMFVPLLASSLAFMPSAILDRAAIHAGSTVLLLISTVFNVIGLIISTIVSLIFSQAIYLLHDFPEYSAKELLRMSRLMMKGHKGRLFYIQVSFIPLVLLGFLSFGIAFLWLFPYMRSTSANFYMDLIKNKNRQGNEGVL